MREVCSLIVWSLSYNNSRSTTNRSNGVWALAVARAVSILVHSRHRLYWKYETYAVQKLDSLLGNAVSGNWRNWIGIWYSIRMTSSYNSWSSHKKKSAWFVSDLQYLPASLTKFSKISSVRISSSWATEDSIRSIASDILSVGFDTCTRSPAASMLKLRQTLLASWSAASISDRFPLPLSPTPGGQSSAVQERVSACVPRKLNWETVAERRHTYAFPTAAARVWNTLLLLPHSDLATAACQSCFSSNIWSSIYKQCPFSA